MVLPIDPPEDSAQKFCPPKDVVLGQKPSTPNLKLKFWTGEELAADTTANEAEWIVKPWIAAGSITEVAGKVKVAGKTTWVTNMVRAVLTGTPFMGYPTIQTPVVYLTEQNKISFRAAMERAELWGRNDLSILFWPDSFHKSWDTIALAALVECVKRRARLLVVDTVAQFAKIVGDKENNAGDALSVMTPLQAITSLHDPFNIGVLLVRHERKSGGDAGDSGRGSSAFAGAVDIVLALRRLEGQGKPTMRRLQAVSRFSETPDELVIELTPTGYEVCDGKEVTSKLTPESLLKALTTTSAEAVTLEDIEAYTNQTRTTIQRILTDLVVTCKVETTGAGIKGNPKRYFSPTLGGLVTKPNGVSAQSTPHIEGRKNGQNGHGPMSSDLKRLLDKLHSSSSSSESVDWDAPEQGDNWAE
jgi:AAA domain